MQEQSRDSAWLVPVLLELCTTTPHVAEPLCQTFNYVKYIKTFKEGTSSYDDSGRARTPISRKQYKQKGIINTTLELSRGGLSAAL